MTAIKPPLSIGKLVSVSLPALLLTQGLAFSGPYRGLWVGQATMNYVNEVSIPLDENNVPRATDPLVATPTADQAHLRLILHVNGADQVSLLKEVAIVDRTGEGEGHESDLALITDESLYAQVKPQVATRLASAVFDFGDSQTTRALDAVVDAVVSQVTGLVYAASSSSFATASSRAALVASVAASAGTAGQSVVNTADATAAFDQFLQATWSSSIVDQVATNPASPLLSAAIVEAAALASGSFYADQRASRMIADVQTAAGAAGTVDAKQQAAQFWTAAYADTANLYHRFIGGQAFGKMITAAAKEAAGAAAAAGASESSVSEAVEAVNAVVTAKSEALNAKVGAYRDTRSSLAVEQVLQAMIARSLSASGTVAFVEAAVAEAGWDARNNSVARYPVSPQLPTTGYDVFIDTAAFQGSAGVAAQAAAQAAVDERADNSLFTASSLLGAAKVAAVNALQGVYSAASRTVASGIPLTGEFGSTNGTLTGVIYLPANHPTNPFRHRRHPDHTRGVDITRELQFTFLSDSTNPIEPVGYGVEKMSGVYREEIHGLHKPLGDDADAPIGLIVIGAFELQRISLIDTLNTL